MWGSSSGHERAVDSRSRRWGNIYPEILGSNHLQSLKMNHWNIGILWNIHMNGNHLLLDISLHPVFFHCFFHGLPTRFPWFLGHRGIVSACRIRDPLTGAVLRASGKKDSRNEDRDATLARPGQMYVVGEAADVSVYFVSCSCFARFVFRFFFVCLFHLEMKWRNLGTMKDSSYPVPSGCYEDFSSYTWDMIYCQ